MKLNKFTLAFRFASLLAVLVSSSLAQIPEKTSPDETEADDIVVLSPFVVSSDSEQGYQATETLAGMRVRTDVKDVGAAIDVLTESFLNDVGAVDMIDALKYVANMQYSEFQSNDAANSAQYYSTPYLSRGIIGSTVLLDFFPTGAVPIDRYNSDNLTLMRGPNNILFGIGSPSGIVGSSTKRALLARKLTSVRFMGDTNETLRSEFDLSRFLIKDKLAFRVDAVLSDRHIDQKPSLNRRNAIYGTVTFKPWKKTTITANAESGIWNRINVQNSVVEDAYTPWVLAGKPLVTSRVGFPVNATTGPIYNQGVGSGLQNQSSASYLVQIQGSNLPIMDWQGMARGAGWSSTVPVGAAGSGMIIATDRAELDNISFNESTTIVPLNTNIFGNTNSNNLNYRRQSIILEQNITHNLDLELAWSQFKSKYKLQFSAYGPSAKIWVDPNVYLPTGDPNPYVGMPYIETGNAGNALRQAGETQQWTNKRATLSYTLNLDNKKIFRNFGFGNYNFGLLAEDAFNQQKLQAVRPVNVTPVVPLGNDYNRPINRVSQRYYLTPGAGNVFQLPDSILVSQSSLPGAPASGNGPVDIEWRMSDEAPRNNKTDTKSYAIAVQGEWWRSTNNRYPHLYGLFGWREDRRSSVAQNFTRDANGEYPIPFNGDFDYGAIEQYGVWGNPSKFTAHTKSYSVTYRPIEPLRLFYNFSNIFNSPAANFNDVRGNPLRPSFGQTEDYGFKLDLLKGRAFVSVTKYKTGIIDRTLDNSSTVRMPILQADDSILTNGSPTADDARILQAQIDDLQRPFTYRDDTTTGYEVALTAAPIKYLNLRLSFGTQKTVVSAAFDDWVPFLDDYAPLWNKYASVLLLSPSAGNTTVGSSIAQATQFLSDARAVIGQQPTDQRSLNSSFNASYGFHGGRLEGFRVGGGWRWASANVLGYARTSTGLLDVSRPFKGESIFYADLNIGYYRKIWHKRCGWDVQLNVYNLLDNSDPKARAAVDNGMGQPIVTRTYLTDPRTFQLTSTFSF